MVDLEADLARKSVLATNITGSSYQLIKKRIWLSSAKNILNHWEILLSIVIIGFREINIDTIMEMEDTEDDRVEVEVGGDIRLIV